MRKNLTFICLLIISNMIAQNKVSLTHRDGSRSNGNGRIKINNTVVFKKEKDGEKVTYDYKTIKSIRVSRNQTDRIYVYKLVTYGGSSTGTVKLLEPVITGKVDLYYSLIMLPNNQGTNTLYYISKKGEDVAKRLEIGNIYSKKFRRIANKYFIDCPDLIEKIYTKYFKRYDLKKVVINYNENCI